MTDTPKSRLYTRTGDNGMTSLTDGSRAPKDSARLEAYGTVDELNSFIGVLIATPGIDNLTKELLTGVQSRLFDIGGYLATDSSANPVLASRLLPALSGATARLESETDRLDAAVPPMHCFVLPQGSAAAAQAHVCRAVCRRAERRILTLASSASVAPGILRYVNRLSDYLFALARYCNHTAGIPDIPWQKDR